MSLPVGIIPYCGVAPTPAALWQRWNLDPILIAALVTVYAGYLLGLVASRSSRKSAVRSQREFVLFTTGWVILSAALISPLCALSVALFSARIGQHMIITMIAAPLVAMGRPFSMFETLAPSFLFQAFRVRMSPASFGTVGAISFAAFLWLWHTPVFYGATFRSDAVYWTMHISLFGSSVLLWHFLLVRGADRPLAAFGIGFATVSQMSLLGAILTFAARPLFPEHILTTAAWGLSSLQDQQFGGLIMWIPGGVLLTITAIALLAGALRESAAAQGCSEIAWSRR